MNGKDRDDLKLIMYRLDDMDKKFEELSKKNREDLKFIKKNLFNPETGLWAETRLNSEFRKNTKQAFWFIIPASIATFCKLLWDTMRGQG